MTTIKENYKIYLMMIVATIFWGGAFVAGKYSADSITPAMLTFLRFFFASIIMVVLMMKKEKRENWAIKKENLLPLILASLTGMVGYHLLFFTSLKYTTAANASLIGATNPIISTILASIFVGEKLEKRKLGFILLAFFGVFMILIDWNIDALKTLAFNIGDIYMLIAVLCFGVYMIIIKKYKTTCSTLVFSTYMFVLCCLFILPIIIYQGFQSIRTITSEGWISIIYMSIFPTVIGYMIQQKSIKEIGVVKTSLFINLVPVSSMILAALIIKENITLTQLFSGVIIIFAVYMNSRIRIKQTKDELAN